MHQLDPFVDEHLNLQVRISYEDHHGFLLRHGLKNCLHVLDVGTGNGVFAACLAKDHPEIQFMGIDKRQACVESCRSHLTANFDAQHVDMFARESAFDFGLFDGFLMRYFLLHVDHAQKILGLFKAKAKRPSRFWIIDLDWSQFSCEPQHSTFDKLTKLVKDFCSQISLDTLGGQNVVPWLRQMDYQDIVVENLPFTNQNVSHEDLTLYLKQEVQCYARMMGRAINDSETAEIIDFIETDVKSGKVQVSYGMALVSARLS
jgi:ubiquinone/menaquinone biosynthesis C-methylase UbiE